MKKFSKKGDVLPQNTGGYFLVYMYSYKYLHRMKELQLLSIVGLEDLVLTINIDTAFSCTYDATASSSPVILFRHKSGRGQVGEIPNASDKNSGLYLGGVSE